MRKNLFQPIPANFIVDDFYLSMIVLEKNKQCICDDKAVCYEDVSNELQQEFRRKTRISAGNFQNLQRFRKFIFKPFSAAGFCFISHKVFRWWGPFALLAILVCSAALSFSNDVYKILCATILFLFAFPVFDFLQKKLELNNYIIRLGSYFVWMNMALLAGYINFKKGVKSNVWDRTERTN
jgi:cellulose synthase/poly-beta-1,6-N-acetylglucosamine synthase-like glycosyltransferase